VTNKLYLIPEYDSRTPSTINKLKKAREIEEAYAKRTGEQKGVAVIKRINTTFRSREMGAAADCQIATRSDVTIYPTLT
jgi:hypothetical protein